MLKLAIVRQHEEPNVTAGQQDILLSYPLETVLAQELHNRTSFGFKKRAAKKAVKALQAIENQIKQETIRL